MRDAQGPDEPEPEPEPEPERVAVERRVALPEGVLAVRPGPGANCSSAGSSIDILFYGSVLVGAIAVALAAAFPPREPVDDEPKAPEPDPPAAPPAG